MNVFFKEAGFEAYLVGGAVRDMLLGKTETDWDLTTNATPEQVMKIFKKVIPTGIAHGTVTVLFMGKQIEVTTYRTDSEYSDGRHPDKVIFTSSLEDDLSRRDFTMNAIAASLETGEIKDPFNGISDIKNKIIRTVGNPFDRFTEDGLRPIRAIRFSSQLDFEIEKKTFEAITTPEVRKKTLGISIERFRDEFVKTLKSNAPSKGFHLMEQTGILEYFIPELSFCRGVIQGDGRGFHEFDVLDHLLYACDGACNDNLIVRLAALFHDIGKPETKREQLSDSSGEKITFYNHESVSERITEKILTRLRFPNATVNEVCHLVKNHM
ncbi:MAG: HD domain-containing protein, partial [Treponema sp.]|nr:HD domain-containing protein [Treponema sp.]